MGFWSLKQGMGFWSLKQGMRLSMECWGQQRWGKGLLRGTNTTLPHTIRLIDGKDGTSCGAMKCTHEMTTMATTNHKLGDMERFKARYTSQSLATVYYLINMPTIIALQHPQAQRSQSSTTISSSEAILQTAALLSSCLDNLLLSIWRLIPEPLVLVLVLLLLLVHPPPSHPP
jgi:hypothetical protein